MAEHRAATIWEQRVGGSNPSAPTIHVTSIQQLAATRTQMVPGHDQ